MLRWLYIQLIWLHPAPFRWRFGDDMLNDFDRAELHDTPRYFIDAVASLARQWLLRPQFRRPEQTTLIRGALLHAAGVPMFQTIEAYKLRPIVLAQGGLLAIVSILCAVLLIGKGGHVKPIFTKGTFSKPGLFHIDYPVGDTNLHTSVNHTPNPSVAWLKLAESYYVSMPVLRALDANRDFTLSPWEIDNAPAAIRNLGADDDGDLVAEKCGLHMDPTSLLSVAPTHLRREFMSYHPVLAVLDADHNGTISASEINEATAALKKLDRNHDGYLSAVEVVPFEMGFRVGLR